MLIIELELLICIDFIFFPADYGELISFHCSICISSFASLCSDFENKWIPFRLLIGVDVCELPISAGLLIQRWTQQGSQACSPSAFSCTVS